MKCLRFVVIWVALAVLFPCGAMAADSWPADAPAVPRQVRRLMQDRNYPEAVKAIDAAKSSVMQPTVAITSSTSGVNTG